jgi:hypothetical protein
MSAVEKTLSVKGTVHNAIPSKSDSFNLPALPAYLPTVGYLSISI